MGRFVANFSSISGGAVDALPYRDLMVFAAASLSVLCLCAAAAVFVSARREAWRAYWRPED